MLAVALVACTGPADPPHAAPSARAGDAPEPTREPAGPGETREPPSAPLPEPTSAAEVRAQGAPDLRLGHVTVHVVHGGVREVTRQGGPDGEGWVVTPDAGRPDGRLVLLAAPEGATFAVQSDGSVWMAPVAGVTDGIGIAPLAPGSYDRLAPDLLAIRAHTGAPGEPVEVRFGWTAVESAAWGEAEGGRSLAVVPTEWGRTGGLAGAELAWRHLGWFAPDDATPGMRDQLLCHVLGAPDKATWNLEPWRPDVGLPATLLAQCNP